jgi:hypothetical protein
MIEAAIDGFEVQKQPIDAQIAELREMLNALMNRRQPPRSGQ